MIIAVVNRAGGQGKTMVAKQLHELRFTSGVIIPVESINAHSSHQHTVLEGWNWKLLEGMFFQLGGADAIVDVGASEYGAWLEKLWEIDDAADWFDYFVVPTNAYEKNQRDTVATIEDLHQLGVQPERIRLLFNFVTRDGAREFRSAGRLQEFFATVFAYHAEKKTFTLDPRAVLYTSEIYDRVGDGSVAAWAHDPTDYKALALASPPGSPEQHEHMENLGKKRMAISALVVLHDAFSALLPQGVGQQLTGEDDDGG